MSYQHDFYGWTQQQVELLKTGHLNELDIENLIEEIETMGRSEKRAVESRLIVLLAHLLKWQYQPDRRGKSWMLTCKGQRLNLETVLDDNPSLKPLLGSILPVAYVKARIEAAKEVGSDENSFPDDCPWSINQIMDQSFYPDT